MENYKLIFKKAEKPNHVLGIENELDFLSSKVAEMITELQEKKTNILKQKFVEKVGMSIKNESLKGLRFNKIMVEHGEGFYSGVLCKHEKWYYNDGSKDGLLIVTFIGSPKPLMPNDGSFSMGIELLYE